MPHARPLLIFLVLLVGAASAAGTFYVQRLGPEVAVTGLHANTADEEYAPALVGGWPLWWVQDNPGVSVWGVLAPIGEDRVRAWAFCADAVFFAMAFLVLGLVVWRHRA